MLDSGTATVGPVFVSASFFEWPLSSLPLASLTSFLRRLIDQSAITDSYDLSCEEWAWRVATMRIERTARRETESAGTYHTPGCSAVRTRRSAP